MKIFLSRREGIVFLPRPGSRSSGIRFSEGVQVCDLLHGLSGRHVRDGREITEGGEGNYGIPGRDGQDLLRFCGVEGPDVAGASPRPQAARTTCSMAIPASYMNQSPLLVAGAPLYMPADPKSEARHMTTGASAIALRHGLAAPRVSESLCLVFASFTTMNRHVCVLAQEGASLAASRTSRTRASATGSCENALTLLLSFDHGHQFHVITPSALPANALSCITGRPERRFSFRPARRIHYMGGGLPCQ